MYKIKEDLGNGAYRIESEEDPSETSIRNIKSLLKVRRRDEVYIRRNEIKQIQVDYYDEDEFEKLNETDEYDSEKEERTETINRVIDEDIEFFGKEKYEETIPSESESESKPEPEPVKEKEKDTSIKTTPKEVGKPRPTKKRKQTDRIQKHDGEKGNNCKYYMIWEGEDTYQWVEESKINPKVVNGYWDWFNQEKPKKKKKKTNKKKEKASSQKT